MASTVIAAGSDRVGVGRDWRDIYATRLAVTDLIAILWVVFGVQIAWLGFESEALGVSGSRDEIAISYSAISLVIVLAWMAALSIYDTRTDRVIGVGAAEYRLIAGATVRLFGLIAIVAFIFKIDLARGYILLAFPLGTGVLILSRWMWRQWLGVQRQQRKFTSKVLLVGSEPSVAQIALQLARQPQAGYLVVGACVPTGQVGAFLPGDIPVSGSLRDVSHALIKSGADTVVITSSDELPPDRLRELNWALEPGKQHLVVAPGLTGIGGPRIHTRPVAGLPLIHVETPRYEGQKVIAKRVFDLCVAGLFLVLLSPLMLSVAAAIRLHSAGPVLFRQSRVGIGGAQFTMFKFRTMAVGADQNPIELFDEARSAGNEVMFKMKNDPRVTPLGKWLRRFSLDELPQLLNVVRGEMSLVGPRPPLESEVAAYEEHVHRRFLVKPGITGLWQVSGRSNLTWEDTVRLDLYYVENWSLIGDLAILWRTARAVLARDGAY